MGIASSIDITAGQRRTILALLERRLPDTEAWVYGSRVKWTSRPQSDLDMVVFATPGQKRAVSDLREAFEESNLPFRVDLFVWDEVPESFRGKIEEEHVVLVPEGTFNAPPRGWRDMPFSDAVQINPEVRLDRGQKYPFIDMASVEPNLRCAYAMTQREYTGGGSRFLCGDTLMARITPCLENGKVARYCSDNEKSPAHGSTEFIVLRGKDSVTDAYFAYYLTQWRKVRQFAIDQMTGTSGRQRVPTKALDHLRVPIPPLAEQRAIAHILGTLDDKIELNRRMNETLEAMAHALFKSWFVDFDPVRAKMEGRDTGLPEEIADLFPDRMEESEIGEIPAGWEVRRLGELIQFNYGKSLRKDKRVPGDFPVYGSGGSETSHVEPLVRHPTVIVGRKGTVGSVFWAPHGCWPIDTTYFVTSELPMTFVYRLLQHLPLMNMNTDAAVPGLNRSNAYRLDVPYPGIKLVYGFAEHSDWLQARIDTNRRETSLSTILRDLLLPKLVSGEIRPYEARRLIGRAV